VTTAKSAVAPDTTAAADRAIKYAGVVSHVGELVADFRSQGLIIFFGENAPEELHEFAVLQRVSVATGGVTVGDDIVLAGQRLRILAVGAVANENLVSLGHLDLKANGETVPPLPGDVCVASGELPELRVGDNWSIEGPGPTETH
jgi:PTS system glucitol/sorbitol-specific IIA component